MRATTDRRAGPAMTGTPVQTMTAHAATRPAKTRASLVGSERVRRHPHRRARSGPPSGVSCGPRAYRVRVPVVRRERLLGFCGLCRRDLGDSLELTEELGMVLRQVAHDPCIPEQLADVALDHGQMQMVLAVGVLMPSCRRASSCSIRAIASGVMPLTFFGLEESTSCACGVPARIAFT